MKKHVIFWVVISVILLSLMGVIGCLTPEEENLNLEKDTPQNKETKSQNIINEDFESGNFSNYAWTLGGNVNPVVQSSTVYEGTYSAKFGTITHDQTSYFQISDLEITSDTTVSFKYKVSSEDRYDFFNFYVNGTKVENASGSVNWTDYTYDLLAGTYTLKWEYKKDYSVSSGDDTAWVDAIVIPDTGTTPPPSDGWQDDFETGNFSANPWTLGGTANPTVQSSTKYEGYYAAKFGTITDNQTSYFEIADVEVNDTASLSFWYKVSSESGYDFFNFYVNGTEVKDASGNVDWTEYTYDFSAGTYTLKWEYKKDYSVSSGSDTAWVDYIVFEEDGSTPPPTYPEIEVSGTIDFGTIEINTSTSESYTISNTGDADLILSGSPKVEINGADASQFSVTAQPSSPVASNGNTTFTIEFAPTTEGTKNASVSIANNDSDENPFTFNISGVAEDNSTPPPADGLNEDFETGNFSANPWTLGGDTNPTVQSSTKHGGTYAAKFGTITHNQTSYFEISNIDITESSKLNFWYKVSSESSYDFFKFYVNGTKVDQYSGNVNWTKYSYDLSNGTYTFKWEYYKDGSVSSNDDTAWIDDIEIISLANAEPEINVLGSADFGTVYVNSTGNKTYTIENIGDGDLQLTGSPLVSISGADASLFTVTTQPSSTIASNGSTSFTIQFAPTTEGTKNATVSIANNDSDENPFAFNITGHADPEPSTQDGWLFMLYMDGDNNLNSALWGDVNEMEYGLYRMSSTLRQNVHFIVFWDGNGSYSGGPEHTYLYELGPDDREDTTLSSSTITLTDGWFTNGDELDMGNGDNLTALINYSRNRYPNMENEVLIMSNHGGGVKNMDAGDRYGWSDDTNGGHLYTNEIQQSLINADCDTDKLSLIGMDACLMGVLEEAYEYRNVSEYFVASPETEQGDGWEFNHWMPQMTTTTTPEGLATILVQSYKYNFDNSYANDQTLTGVDLSEMENLKVAIDNLAEKMYAEGQTTSLKNIISNTANVTVNYQRFFGFMLEDIYNGSYSTALRNAAQSARTALGNAVVYAWADTAHDGGYYGAGSTIKNGLTIVTDDQYWYTDQAYSSYGRLDFCTTTNDGTVNTWKELLSNWY